MAANSRYRLADGYLLDWDLFRPSYAERGRREYQCRRSRMCLELVRGVPFDGQGYRTDGVRDPYHWLPGSHLSPHLLVAAIRDTAHQLVLHHLDKGNIPAARWAVGKAWLAEPDPPDESWLDLMQVCAAAGHTGEQRALADTLLEARGLEVPEDLPPGTYWAIHELEPLRSEMEFLQSTAGRSAILTKQNHSRGVDADSPSASLPGVKRSFRKTKDYMP